MRKIPRQKRRKSSWECHKYVWLCFSFFGSFGRLRRSRGAVLSANTCGLWTTEEWNQRRMGGRRNHWFWGRGRRRRRGGVSIRLQLERRRMWPHRDCVLVRQTFSTSSVAGVCHVASFSLMRESGGWILRHVGVLWHTHTVGSVQDYRGVRNFAWRNSTPIFLQNGKIGPYYI